MSVRTIAIAIPLVAASPATARELTPAEAQSFVAGKLLSYTCSDGTFGEGRIAPDGSVAGFVHSQGRGPIRFAMLPTGTLRIKGEAICASLKGLAWEPCFRLVQINRDSFRASILGLNSLHCTFMAHNPSASAVRSLSAPLSLDAFMKVPGSKVKQRPAED